VWPASVEFRQDCRDHYPINDFFLNMLFYYIQHVLLLCLHPKMARLYGVKRKYKKQGGRSAKRTKTWVRGHRGGRPSYGTMMRNSWPWRQGGKTRQSKYVRPRTSRRLLSGNSLVTSCSQNKRGMKHAAAFKALSADHTIEARGAFALNLANTGKQLFQSKVFQLGNDAATDGTQVMSEFVMVGGNVEGGAIFKKGTRAEFSIVSASTAMCKLTMYDVVSKKNKVRALTYNQSPENCLANSYDRDFQAATDVTHLVPGMGLPPGRNTFNQEWKVLKTSSVVLNPGQVHIHKFNRTSNKKCLYSDLCANFVEDGQVSTGFRLFKDVTYGTLFRLEGFPMTGTTSGINFPSAGFAKCNVTWKHSSTFYAIANLSRNITVAANAVDPYAEGLTGSVTMIGDDGGLVTNYAVS